MNRRGSARPLRPAHARGAQPGDLVRGGLAGVLAGACLGLAYGLLWLPHPVSYAAGTAWVGMLLGAAVGTVVGWLGARRRTRAQRRLTLTEPLPPAPDRASGGASGPRADRRPEP